MGLALYSAAGVRELDRNAIEVHGIAGAELMERAGRRVWQCMQRRWPRAQRIHVYCGTGNNGGDGFVVAELARRAGRAVTVIQLGRAERISGDARHWADRAAAAQVPRCTWADRPAPAPDLIVDALLGTGLQREVSGQWREAIEHINAQRCPRIAVDVPSGLNADTGAVMGVSITADLTVSFIGRKQGLYTGQGPAVCGEVNFSDLAVPGPVYDAVAPSAELLEYAELAPLLAPRSRTAHKGHFGHSLIVGGDHGYAGAARMAAEAAARVGSGLVSLATRPLHATAITAARPEIMCRGVDDPGGLKELLDAAKVVAVGPGLGQSAWAVALLSSVLERRIVKVLDADALNLLAADPVRRDDWILTPHPGEAARLLGVTSAEIQADRFAAARDLQARYGGVCILKGAGSLVADDAGRLALCGHGNPGMASGGMGDVLSGVLAGLLAQGLTLADAARLGVLLHAMAADRAARDGERGMLAGDLMAQLRTLVNPVDA